MDIPNQKLEHPILIEKDISLYVKREDRIHPFISGNKFRKLKYNLIAAKEADYTSILTFGGAFSNHIAATAYAGATYGFKTIGVIRGEELEGNWKGNPTLDFAFSNGMRFKFVSRETYRKKNSTDFLETLNSEYGRVYVLPEGGTNNLAVKGCEEILTKEDKNFKVIVCCVGTGGTIAGIVNASSSEQMVLGFPALKGDFLKEDIRKFALNDNWTLIPDYHFGGYAKVDVKLIDFINDFRKHTAIPLDPVYTGKMMYGLFDLISKDYFPVGTTILAIHSGGLQGIMGMNQKLKKKKLPLLHI